MKKFKFQLEPVLRLRTHKEQQALLALGQAHKAQLEARKRLLIADAEASGAKGAALEPEYQAQRDLYLKRLSILCFELSAALSLADAAFEDARAKAALAQAERKAVERLKERHLAKWKTEAQREEDRDLSEAAR